jgi:hypothetical protein
MNPTWAVHKQGLFLMYKYLHLRAWQLGSVGGALIIGGGVFVNLCLIIYKTVGLTESLLRIKISFIFLYIFVRTIYNSATYPVVYEWLSWNVCIYYM